MEFVIPINTVVGTWSSIQGFQRVYDGLPEIKLDVPHAHSIIESFVDQCYQESVITKQLRDACPSRLVDPWLAYANTAVVPSHVS